MTRSSCEGVWVVVPPPLRNNAALASVTAVGSFVGCTEGAGVSLGAGVGVETTVGVTTGAVGSALWLGTASTLAVN